MKCVDETPVSTHLFRTVLDEATMVGTLVATATYAMLDDGRLVLARDQPPPRLEPTVVDGVTLPPDGGYGKRGVDVLAIGHAHAPGGGATEATMAGLSIAGRYLGIAVIGDRVWRRRWPSFVASDPEPFERMPLDWSRAFGGRARVRGTEVPLLDNPSGRGYVLDPAAAEGVALPNLESVDDRLRHPLDAPAPVAFAPLLPGNRYVRELVDRVDEDGRGLDRSLYNVALPEHRLPDYPGGAPLQLHALTPGPMRPVALPTARVIAEVRLDGHPCEVPASVDTILVCPDRRTLSITHRAVFRYDYLRGRARVVRARWREAA